MALLQHHFTRFDEAIRLDWSNDDGLLRERREPILERLRLGGLDVSPFSDLGLDVGLIFAIDRSAWPNPVALKQRVAAALSGYAVEIRRPCLRVRLQGDGPRHHVDLSLYRPSPIADGLFELAVGKVGDGTRLRGWRTTNPHALGAVIDQRFPDLEDRAQLRRIVRALKRWKDRSFATEAHARPTGIALTASAIEWFSPKKAIDPATGRAEPRDLEALASVVASMVADASPRLVARLPVSPQDDTFARVSRAGMEVLHARLVALRDGLEAALRDDEDERASTRVRELFGDDFPRVATSP
ncbi:MAG: hypothetical protein R3B09_15395 [Nannocystaceae bacterium]